jgi:hypothetical protein
MLDLAETLNAINKEKHSPRRKAKTVNVLLVPKLQLGNEYKISLKYDKEILYTMQWIAF